VLCCYMFRLILLGVRLQPFRRTATARPCRAWRQAPSLRAPANAAGGYVGECVRV